MKAGFKSGYNKGWDYALYMQILSPDSNFELKGSITQGVCFSYKENPETLEKWLILEVHLL